MATIFSPLRIHRYIFIAVVRYLSQIHLDNRNPGQIFNFIHIRITLYFNQFDSYLSSCFFGHALYYQVPGCCCLISFVSEYPCNGQLNTDACLISGRRKHKRDSGQRYVVNPLVSEIIYDQMGLGTPKRLLTH